MITVHHFLRCATFAVSILVVDLSVFAPPAKADSGSASATSETTHIFVETFKSFCTPDLSDAGASTQRALEAGWQVVEPSVSTNLSKILAVSDNSEKSGALLSTHRAVLRKIQGQQTYFGVLSGVIVNGKRAHGCYIYDFEANQAVSSAAVTRWLEQEPAKTAQQSGIVSETWLTPRRLPGYLTIKSMFGAKGSQLAEQFGLVGIALATTQVVESP